MMLFALSLLVIVVIFVVFKVVLAVVVKTSLVWQRRCRSIVAVVIDVLQMVVNP
jgi:hypothetical protein